MAPLILATVADVRTALQSPDLDEASTQLMIDRVSALIRAMSGQQLDWVQGDVVELRGGSRELELPQRPVVVDSENPLIVECLGADGSAWPVVEGQGWYRQGSMLVRSWPSMLQPGGVVADGWMSYLPVAAPGVWPARVRVTYSHGFTVAPLELLDLVVSAVQTTAINPGGLRSRTVGQMTDTWATETLGSPGGLSQMIRDGLKATGFRRRGAFSIAPA